MLTEDDRLFLATLALRVCDLLIHSLGEGRQIQAWRSTQPHVRAEFRRLATGQKEET